MEYEPTPESTPISAYDDVIRSVSASAGVDWRLVSAIVYHESRFHNSASSVKGAVGLMQVHSPRYEDEALLDSRINLEIGTAYLRRLQKMFSPMAADTTECLKFALAAYNAGEGKVQNIIGAASREGLDSSRWDAAKSVSTTRVPAHTVAYVESVLDKYREYAIRFPER